MAFILADAGYDVWMPNTRGNKYNKQHTSLNPEKDWKYWNNGSSVDMAKHDIPAFIEYVIEITEVKNITIIALN